MNGRLLFEEERDEVKGEGVKCEKKLNKARIRQKRVKAEHCKIMAQACIITNTVGVITALKC